MESLTKAIVEQKMPVIATSSTCAFTLRDEYPHILDVDTAPLRDNIELVTRYLYRLMQDGRKPVLRHMPLKVGYHTPCHMEKWAGRPIPLSLSAQFRGGTDRAGFTMLWYRRNLRV